MIGLYKYLLQITTLNNNVYNVLHLQPLQQDFLKTPLRKIFLSICWSQEDTWGKHKHESTFRVVCSGYNSPTLNIEQTSLKALFQRSFAINLDTMLF